MTTKDPNDLLGTAIAIASSLHEGQRDKGGKAYILHPIRIMMRLRTDDPELMSIAILHDTIEDSNGNVTINMLQESGFSDRVLDALELLTHNKEDSYEDYIKNISTNKDAIRVKLEDLRDNSDLTRLKGVRQKDFDRAVKYQKAYTFLKSVLQASEQVGY